MWLSVGEFRVPFSLDFLGLAFLEPDFFELDFLEPASDLHWAGKSALHNEI